MPLIYDCQAKRDIAEQVLLMWANHYHRNPTLLPVEISFSGRLNTFVGNLSLGQCLEITLSLFK